MKSIVATVVVFVFFSLSCGSSPSAPASEITADRVALEDATTSSVSPAAPKPASTPEAGEEYREALESIWIDSDHFKLNDISITRNCKTEAQSDYLGECELFIKSKGRTVRSFSVEHGRKYWLKYGFIDLLGTSQKQLVVFRYSGGAHCCYDYTIFALKPQLRIIYDSNPSDSANEVGNELVPVDIDSDGVFEFYRDVMAFDYMGAAGHAGASFPPAIFAYDKKVGKYLFATKRFPEFVTKQLDELLSGIEPASETNLETLDEYRVRTKFLYMVYAGQRDAGWKYFEENYRSAGGNGYQEQFKEQLKKEFVEIFAKDPTYLSIYGRK